MTTTEEAPPQTVAPATSAPVDPFARPTRGRHAAPRPARAPRSARAPLPPAFFVTAWVLAVASALTFGAVFYGVVLSAVQEHRSQTTMYAELRSTLALATTPIGGQIAAGTPIALLDAPAIGLHQVVVEGTTSHSLTLGPGHFAASPLPGQSGTSYVFGRSVTFGAPFGGITSLRAGETLTVTTGQGVFTYTVTGVRHRGDPAPPAPTAGQSQLVLVSSDATGWRDGLAPYRTVYVDTTLQGKVQPTPLDAPQTVVPAALPMKGDPAALVPLLLWLQATALVAVGLVIVRRRWGLRQTWLGGFPIALAVLWGTASTAILLLPNLI